MTPQILEEIVAPDISHLIIEDDTPLDNFQTEKQQRLLVEPLYSSWQSGNPFVAAANVGIFSSDEEEGTAPDAFLSLGVSIPADWSQKQNRSYLVWRFGKFPEVVIEIVSNRKGNELVRKDLEKPCKKEAYARMGIAYYAVFDPLQQIQEESQMNGQPLKVFELRGKHYDELSQPFWMEDAGLGLTLWDGEFEGVSSQWLRWCERDGQLIPTGAERAGKAELKAQRLAERLRAMGVNPDEI
ncbi:MAG: Uma2 family endonuclease [Chroococcidiopsidaceae cyanobacterium CP_BM_ER_R8_30]|nr:Uma2 family endonuclease [Chroococcidiopsidaceae cyanobacterium CP_BM_ER_R8_30]